MLASLGVLKSVADVNRKIVMTLTSDYETEERTILYCEGVIRTEIESIVRQGTYAFPHRRAKTWARPYFRMELLVAVSRVEV